MLHNLAQRSRQIIQPFFNLFLESICPLCQRSAPDLICRDCQRRIRQCQFAGDDRAQPPSLLAFAWGDYTGALKQAIAALKYRQQPQLAQPLGYWMAEAWLASPLSKGRSLTVVPIPMHAKKQQQRGYNQAELLARSFCQTAQLPLNRELLQRSQDTEAQFGLTAAQREQNLAHAFELGRPWAIHPPHRSILLLDDIYTTGATARAAVRVLQQRDIAVYGVVALACPKLRRE